MARIFRRLAQLLDVDLDSTPPADGDALTYDSGSELWVPAAGGGGGGGAPTDGTYLVATANGTLSAEVVVGATPGGELGGTWASPTVDASHSGSTHASVQAAAEATAAAALTAHEADTTNVHGIPDTSALALTANHPSNATFNDHSARHENGGADEISIAGLDGTSTELAAHLADSSDAHDASAISIADAGNDFTATDVEGALAELQGDHETDAQNLADHIADTADAHDASAISVADAGGYFTATDAEGVLQEIAPQLVRVFHDETLGSAANFDVQNIPAGRTLILRWVIRTTRAVSADAVLLRFNNDSGGNYDYQYVLAIGSTAGDTQAVAAAQISLNDVPGASATANHWANGTVEIPGYSDTSHFKQVLSSSWASWGTASTDQEARVGGGQWRSTSAINRIQLISDGGSTFAIGSRLIVYIV